MIEAFDPHIGRQLLGRYRVVRVLASGGQGTVYLARGEGAAGFVRPLVVKRILGRFEADQARQDHFAREARITAQLRHPGIVPVLDFARDGDCYMMVLEYVHGFDLRRWERYVRRTKGDFPVNLAVYAVIKVLEALEYAHTLRGADRRLVQVIHRDISPSNVLIDVGGHVKLTDFGIARMQSEQTTETDTKHNIKGKLPYIAPEMFREQPPSVLTDIYSCAVMLHELLAGSNEFRGSNAAEVAVRALEHVPTRLDRLRTDVPTRVAKVIARALSKDPRHRPGSAAAFSEALREAIGRDLSELRTEFCEAVKSDFENPRMPRTLGVPDLATLERSWRQWDTAEFNGAAAAPQIDDGATEVESVSLTTRSRRRLAARWALLVAAIAVVVGVGVRGTDALAARAPQYIFRAPPASEVGAASGPAKTPSKPPSKAAKLTEAFAKRQAEVAQCFSEHGGSDQKLWVHFSVARDGQVNEVRVTPKRSAKSDLGVCVTHVAEQVRFGKQPQAVSFRIPIRATRR